MRDETLTSHWVRRMTGNNPDVDIYWLCSRTKKTHSHFCFSPWWKLPTWPIHDKLRAGSVSLCQDRYTLQWSNMATENLPIMDAFPGKTSIYSWWSDISYGFPLDISINNCHFSSFVHLEFRDFPASHVWLSKAAWPAHHPRPACIRSRALKGRWLSVPVFLLEGCATSGWYMSKPEHPYTYKQCGFRQYMKSI